MNLRKLQIGFDLLIAAGFAEEGSSNNPYLNSGFQIRASFFPVANKIGLEFNHQFGTEVISGLKASKTEIRGSFALFSSKKTKERSIYIDHFDRSVFGLNRTFKTPQTVQNNFEGRFTLLRNKGFLGELYFPSYFMEFVTLYNSTAFGFGFQWRNFRAHEVLINNEYFAKNSKHFQIYGDVLMGLSTTWSNPEVVGFGTPTQAEIKAELEEEDLKTNIGGRIGFKVSSNTLNRFAFSYGAEIGYLPPNKILNYLMYVGASVNMF